MMRKKKKMKGCASWGGIEASFLDRRQREEADYRALGDKKEVINSLQDGGSIQGENKCLGYQRSQTENNKQPIL